MHNNKIWLFVLIFALSLIVSGCGYQKGGTEYAGKWVCVEITDPAETEDHSQNSEQMPELVLSENGDAILTIDGKSSKYDWEDNDHLIILHHLFSTVYMPKYGDFLTLNADGINLIKFLPEKDALNYVSPDPVNANRGTDAAAETTKETAVPADNAE